MLERHLSLVALHRLGQRSGVGLVHAVALRVLAVVILVGAQVAARGPMVHLRESLRHLRVEVVVLSYLLHLSAHFFILLVDQVFILRDRAFRFLGGLALLRQCRCSLLLLQRELLVVI
jgi:hypothetical protein